jgi:hypothetical protein
MSTPPPGETLEERGARLVEEANAAFWRANPNAYRIAQRGTNAAMPNVNQMLRSKYLGKQDLPQPVIAHIRGVAMEPPGRNGEDPGWLMFFSELRKPLKLNNTILKYIAEVAGPESDRWIGLKCKVYVDHTVQFAGQMVGGVRLQVARSNRVAPAQVAQQMFTGAGGQAGPQGGPVFAGNATVAQPTAGAGAPPGPPPARFPPTPVQGAPNPQPAPGAEIWPGYGAMPPQAVDGATGEFQPGVDPDFDDDIPF